MFKEKFSKKLDVRFYQMLNLGFLLSNYLEWASPPGKLLETTNKTNFSLADYPSGVYSLKVTYGNKVEQLKVIKD